MDQEPERVNWSEDWQVIESLLPEHWQSQARQLGALKRTRGVRDARMLLRLMLIHLAQGCSLRETAAQAQLAGIAQISDVALLKRLRSCGAWFEWMAGQVRQAPELQAQPLAGQSLLSGRRLRVVDGSVVREPGPTGSQWRLHYAIGLPDLQCQEVHLGSARQGETLKRFEVRAGDVFVADRGYAHPAGIAHVRAGGGDVLVRLNLVTLPLYETGVPVAKAQKLDILACARTVQIGQPKEFEACVHPKEGAIVRGRLCIARKSQQAAARARQRVQRESQRSGTQMQPQTLEAADYVFVFTSLSQELSAQQVLQIYRLRWQIELEFKRLKSLISLGHLKKHDEQAARSWLQGKLLVAFLIARMIAHAERVSPWGYEIEKIAYD
ncbi:IS4 family transposase [Ottowia sp. VDI28]|uniref:IS4 family transposase n=1 Tax=Ottowia sp. VDI28 TaxID=3133968 RepID=UPI003C2CF5A5